ncbi:MAG: glucose-1-phosphate cytidylyltransferase, partial [Rhodospirillaceae bacterium]
MKTVILCGGQGTRIRDVSESTPKPMLPIGGRPILWHIMKSYAAGGHTDFVLCLGHLGHVIKEFFLNYEAFTNDVTLTLGATRQIEHHGDHDETGWRITLADTGPATMTGGRVGRIKKYIGDDTEFMLTYGDGVSDIDLDALLSFHRAHGKIMTVSGVRPPGRFGEIESADDGTVTEFNEKPQATGGRISGGFFVCKREIFDHLSNDENLVLELEPMKALAAEGQMALYKHDGFWQCMDTHRD